MKTVDESNYSNNFHVIYEIKILRERNSLQIGFRTLKLEFEYARHSVHHCIRTERERERAITSEREKNGDRLVTVTATANVSIEFIYYLVCFVSHCYG